LLFGTAGGREGKSVGERRSRERDDGDDPRSIEVPTPSQSPTPDQDARDAFAFDDFDDPTRDAAHLGNSTAPKVRHAAGATFNVMSDDFDLPPRQEWEIATNFHNRY
jgi:hypothetical protein